MEEIRKEIIEKNKFPTNLLSEKTPKAEAFPKGIAKGIPNKKKMKEMLKEMPDQFKN